ncbi:leucine-rich repeat domain-containing protein [Chitinophaga agrisoli]|uniref:Leucine-rich repeat domain-containing protein n=1 Tax=Chitinophaga agrisoli TaxID=2607653 RepID=A0A5B2VIV2_9BACT|nr:leucine-rich repeat domain-containing protein [Chitinophaga agrisoli]KAA2238865.1 leucine-rich repeat domain-containing protein [Chitinophaga agrisoli]
MGITKIYADMQDRESVAWKKLCEYIELVAAEGRTEFYPREYLGTELFYQIHSLPESIAKLKSVTKLRLYGSKLTRLPPEIGQMSALEYLNLDPSDELCWCPYELVYCKNLRDSDVRTRALYGNFKGRKPFPDLNEYTVRYTSDRVCCSICKKELGYDQVNQAWISLWIGTDVMPLLANLCSPACADALPTPPPGYIPYAHKGGRTISQKGLDPELDAWRFLCEKNPEGFVRTYDPEHKYKPTLSW